MASQSVWVNKLRWKKPNQVALLLLFIFFCPSHQLSTMWEEKDVEEDEESIIGQFCHPFSWTMHDDTNTTQLVQNPKSCDLSKLKQKSSQDPFWCIKGYSSACASNNNGGKISTCRIYYSCDSVYNALTLLFVSKSFSLIKLYIYGCFAICLRSFSLIINLHIWLAVEIRDRQSHSQMKTKNDLNSWTWWHYTKLPVCRQWP